MIYDIWNSDLFKTPVTCISARCDDGMNRARMLIIDSRTGLNATEGSRIYEKPPAREVEPPRILVAFLGVLRQHRLSAALVSRRQNRQGRTGPAFMYNFPLVFWSMFSINFCSIPLKLPDVSTNLCSIPLKFCSIPLKFPDVSSNFCSRLPFKLCNAEFMSPAISNKNMSGFSPSFSRASLSLFCRSAFFPVVSHSPLHGTPRRYLNRTVVAPGYPALYTPIEGSRIYEKPPAREVEPPRILVAFLGVLRQHRLSAALVSRRQNRQGRTGPAFVTIP
ncbi:hypothetical protein NQ318_003220 [Aromia moschata]|uniref:Uncharacterized protein n=1 Tax=Aromia moschata TaxID=1265417 RepID=A0AAV8YN08_9CUCU|nr:hypothetical protein NQ318_003220 [Aromia moschata]